MSIEEKAKAYDGALERMKSWARGEHPEYFTEAQKAAEFIFPELKESEDEMIRQFLIKQVTETSDEIMSYRNMNKEDVLAWLEKQGSEPNWCHHKVDLSDCSEEYCKAYYDGWNNCNQQHAQLKAEQKPAFEMKSAEESLGIDSETYNKIVNECVYGEQKPAWSEEDEETLKDIITSMTNLKDSATSDALRWIYDSKINWLESLKGRYTWKPSDGQMASITCAVRKMKESVCYDSELVSLLNDLKKLKE